MADVDVVTLIMTKDDLQVLIERAVQNAFRDAGVHIKDDADLDESRSDFRFVRKLRKASESAFSKAIALVFISIVGGGIGLFILGVKNYVGQLR